MCTLCFRSINTLSVHFSPSLFRLKSSILSGVCEYLCSKRSDRISEQENRMPAALIQNHLSFESQHRMRRTREWKYIFSPSMRQFHLAQFNLYPVSNNSLSGCNGNHYRASSSHNCVEFHECVCYRTVETFKSKHTFSSNMIGWYAAAASAAVAHFTGFT